MVYSFPLRLNPRLSNVDILPTLLETILNLVLSLSKQFSKKDNGEAMMVIFQAVLNQATTISASTNAPPVVAGEIVTRYDL